MISLYPEHSEVTFDAATAVAAEARMARPGRPWVMTNMIGSADGATAIDGLSGELGGPADGEMFAALRAMADVILVGSSTVTAEDYRPPGPGSEQVQADRAERGQARTPTVAVVTASGSLDPEQRLFSDDDNRPIVATVASAPPERIAPLRDVAEVIVVGEDQVDLGALVGELATRGAGVVLAEGGPTINGQLVAADLIDEWNLTIAPLLVGGTAKRPAQGPEVSAPRNLRLDRVWHADDLLFCRWARRTDGS